MNLGHGATVALVLLDPELGVGVRGDLAEMGHAQNLMRARQLPEAAAHGLGAPSADAGIDLVEDERRGVIGLGQDLLDGQGDA